MTEAESQHAPAMQIPVIRYEPRSLRGEVLAPRGSVVVYLGARGSKKLRAIRAHARRPRSREFAAHTSDRSDDKGYVVSLTFHDRVLAENVRVPRGDEVVRLILPFAGGDFDASELLLHTPGDRGAVEAIAIRHDPPVSAVESAALSLLPRDMLKVQLGAALPGGVALNNDEERRRQAEEQRRAADEARQERAQQQAEAQAERAADRAERRQGGSAYFDVHLLDDTIKSISSLQTATAMLEIRRQLLLEQMGGG